MIGLEHLRAFALHMGRGLLLVLSVAQLAGAQTEGDWRVAPHPSLVLGHEAGGFPFDNVRSAVRLPDGKIVVADGGLSSRLSLFSPKGEFLRLIGGTGAGPGEFKWITSLDLTPKDSLFVFDAGLQRLTVYSAAAQRVRTATFRIQVGVTGGDGLAGIFRLADGAVVGLGAESMVEGPVGTLVRDTIVVGLLDANLEGLRTLTHLAGRMTTTTLLEGHPVFRVPAFSPEVISATWGNCVFVSSADDRSIKVYSSAGSLVTEFEGPGTARAVTRQDLDVRLAFDLDTYGRQREASLRRLLFSEAHPRNLPYYHRMIIDEWGDLWLQEYTPPWGVGRRWFVLSQDGAELGRVEIPTELTVFEIGSHGVLGRRNDELGEHLVVLLPWATVPQLNSNQLPECRPPSGS